MVPDRLDHVNRHEAAGRVAFWGEMIGLALAVALVASAANAASDPSKDWIEGFAAGSLDRGFGIEVSDIELRGSVLHVWIAKRPQDLQLDTVVRSLLDIRGVDEVRIYASGGDAEPIAQGATPASGEPEAVQGGGLELFPKSELFAPLAADPRWPRFALGVLWYLDDPELSEVASVSFGETFPLLRLPLGASGDLELGIQGGVFSVFDLGAASFDLVNSDFLGGLFVSHRFGDASATLRVYHQSSHLGDEFVLRDRANRVNLSFEVVELLFDYGPTDWLRVYGGAGALVHREPALDRWLTQMGVEVESPQALLGGRLRPVASLDLQLREESRWKADVSLNWGFQIEHPRLRRLRLRLLGEYYSGRSPNGQFFVRRIETIGVGLHAQF